MVVGRRSARRQAVFALYKQDLLRIDPEEAITALSNDDTGTYTIALLRGTSDQLTVIDETLQQHLADWSLDRLGVLEPDPSDRNV